MISESLPEIYFSIISALIFGLIFSALVSTFRLFFTLFNSVIYLLPKSILKKIDLKEITATFNLSLKKEGRVALFFKIVFLAIGFSLLSYFALDGEIRLYMVFFYSAAIFVSNIAFLALSKFILPPLVLLFLIPLRFLLKIIAIPSKHIFGFITAKIKPMLMAFTEKTGVISAIRSKKHTFKKK